MILSTSGCPVQKSNHCALTLARHPLQPLLGTVTLLGRAIGHPLQGTRGLPTAKAAPPGQNGTVEVSAKDHSSPKGANAVTPALGLNG